MKESNFKLKALTKYCLLSSFIYSGSSAFILYAETMPLLAPSYAEFDRSTLVGGAQNMDLSIYSKGNPVIPGKYNVNLYVNDVWVGKREFEFKKVENSDIAEHCFDLEQLMNLGVDIAKIKSREKEKCSLINAWIPDAVSRMNPSDLRYDISIPQAYLKRQARGYVPPEMWDRGINAGYLGYNFNTQHTTNNHISQENSYLSLNGGLNLFGWQFRHNGISTWYEGQNNQYTNLNTYAQRSFPSIRSILTIGQSNTSGELFDSFGFTGVQLRSDDRMLPETQTGYAPVIRGVAQTNAIVEVRQRDQLIYQTSVAPGEFVIEDLFPTGYGGNMDVTVREANGQIQRFSVPYASLTQMLRPGHDRYSVTAGQVRDKRLLKEDNFAQATYQRGINNHLTGYIGSIISQNYQAYQLGSAIGTPIGAVSLDMTHSTTDLLEGDQKTVKGQSYKISYSKFWIPTNTNFTLAAYRYSTSGYYTFQDANSAQDYIRRGFLGANVTRTKSQFQLSLNQNLWKNWGTLYATGTWNEYWNNSGQRTDYQVGYSNHYKLLNYNLSAQRTTDMYGKRDDHYYLTLTMPLTFKKRSATITQMVSDNGNSTSINGAINDDRTFNYGLSVNDIGYNRTSGSANLQYISPYTTGNVSASTGRDFHQYGLTLTGALVAHSHGLSFSPNNVDTLVLVHAENAEGAAINNSVGVKVDPWGYAVVPYVTPYRINEIMIDPKGVSDKVELMSNSLQLAPYAGAIAKAEFKTKSGFPLLIKAKTPNGEALPFASNVYNSKGEAVGVVSQGSQIFIRTDKKQDTVVVKWGDDETKQCHVTYDLNSKALPDTGYKVIEEQCK